LDFLPFGQVFASFHCRSLLPSLLRHSLRSACRKSALLDFLPFGQVFASFHCRSLLPSLLRHSLRSACRKSAFTLAEVLITLVIIGVVAAITVPSLNNAIQDKEYAQMLRKNFSTLDNALRRAQADEGTFGDNSIVFVPDTSSDRHYNTAKNLAKYLNYTKICKNRNDTDCRELYYARKYATDKVGTYNPTSNPQIFLSDGSIWSVNQNTSCEWVANDCVQKSNGDCKKDENGNKIPNNVNRTDCGWVHIDVNGMKGPNKYGKDCFYISVYSNKIAVSTWGPWGGQKGRQILLGKY